MESTHYRVRNTTYEIDTIFKSITIIPPKNCNLAIIIPFIESLVVLPSRTFCVTVNVLPVSRGTVQFTGSGERMIICSGDFTLVGSGGLFTTGSSSSQGLAWVTGTGAPAFVVCDGGVEATLESPPVTSPFTWGSAVTGTFETNRFIVNVDDRSRSPPTPPNPRSLHSMNYL